MWIRRFAQMKPLPAAFVATIPSAVLSLCAYRIDLLGERERGPHFIALAMIGTFSLFWLAFGLFRREESPSGRWWHPVLANIILAAAISLYPAMVDLWYRWFYRG